MALEVHQQQQPTTTTSSSCRQQNTDLQRSVPTTLDLFQSKLSSFPVELDQQLPLPLGRQKFLDLKTGAVYYKDSTEMSRNGKNPKLDLKLHLSPPRRSNWQSEESPKSSSSTSASSCMSSEAEMGRCPSSPEETVASMVLVGCPRCLMYVMLSEEDPKCPKCKSTVLLDFLHINYNNTRTTNSNNRSNSNINNNNTKNI